MQETPAFPHSIPQVLYTLAGVLAVAIPTVIRWFINRKRQAPEIKVLDSTDEKNRAEALKGRAEARRAEGEALNIAWDRIDELQDANYTLRCSRDEWQMKAEKQEPMLKLNELQIKKLRAILDLNGISYKDYDGL